VKPFVCAALLLVSVPACSLVTDPDLDRLDPQSNGAGLCAAVASCDDGIACTNDFCVAADGTCAHEPDPDACDPTQQCHPTQGCLGGEPCEEDQDCVDPTGCASGRCAGHRCHWEPIDPDAPSCQ
jgi:hypothetical protein